MAMMMAVAVMTPKHRLGIENVLLGVQLGIEGLGRL
jgi:hypothetical protein